MSIKYLVHKIKHWEYWPQWLVYMPIIPVYLWYAARLRNIYFNVVANPGIENGGYIMESKFTLYHQLPKNIQPKTILASIQNCIQQIKNELYQSGIQFPVVCKPNIGGKGVGVSVIQNEQALETYHFLSPIEYLIQEKIPYSHEVGIFYYKIPGKQQGKISGIVYKNNMQVVGNGIKTLKQLIEENPRYYYQRKFLFTQFSNRLQEVIAKGTIVYLSSIGNHARGSMFTNISHLNNKALEQTIHQLVQSIDGFYFGRLDIMYNNWDELCNGKNFMLVELNGSGSEPTHLYDPNHSLWQAWKIILKHWHLLYIISKKNIKQGYKLPSHYQIISLMAQWKNIKKKLKKL